MANDKGVIGQNRQRTCSLPGRRIGSREYSGVRRRPIKSHVEIRCGWLLGEAKASPSLWATLPGGSGGSRARRRYCSGPSPLAGLLDCFPVRALSDVGLSRHLPREE